MKTNKKKLPTFISLKGFTLIELLIVVAIIAILAVIVIFFVANAQKKSRDVKRTNDTAQIKKAMDLYYQDHDEYIPAPPFSDLGTYLFCYDNDNSCYSPLLPYIGDPPKDPKPAPGLSEYYQIAEQPSTSAAGYGILIPYEVEGTRGCQTGNLNAPDRCGCKIGEGMLQGWWSDILGNLMPACK